MPADHIPDRIWARGRCMASTRHQTRAYRGKPSEENPPSIYVLNGVSIKFEICLNRHSLETKSFLST